MAKFKKIQDNNPIIINNQQEINKLENREVKDLNKTNSDIELVNINNSDVPFFVTKNIPSGFKTYPDEKIYYKSFKWKEIRLFTLSKLDTLESWKLILSGIHANFDKMKITLQDFSFLSIARRLATIGHSKFNASILCQNNIKGKKCNNINTFTLIDRFEFDDLKLNKNEIIEINLRGKWYKFSPLTIEDAIFLLENDLLNDEVSRKAIQCRNEDFHVIKELIDDLDYLEGEYLDLLDEKFFHGMLPIEKDFNNNELKCSKCKSKLALQLDEVGIIIHPFREFSTDGRDRIRSCY